MSQTPTANNLWKKILSVMKETGIAQKTGYNDFHKYAYTTESDVIEMIRPQLMEQGLIVLPSLKEWMPSRNDVTEIQVAFKVVDVESGAEVEVIMPGSGQDKGDKGPYKAMTGAQKYFLMKVFMIPTEDDPEKESTAPARPQNPVPSRPSVPARPATRPTTGSGASQLKVDPCAKCGGNNLTIKVSNSPKNPGREYLNCATCNGFSRWLSSADTVATTPAVAPSNDDGALDSLASMDAIGEVLGGFDGEAMTLEM